MDSSADRRLYLSPHFDDIAYSLGEWVSLNPGGTMIDIFTRTAYLALGAPKGLPTREDVERISAIRDAEDRAFAEAAGLERILVGAEEPSLRGRKSRDPAGMNEDAAQIRSALVDLLDGFAAKGRFRLYCPAAIGGHVNHLATRAVVTEWVLAKPRDVALLFYEDLPYAARGSQRRRGLRDLKALMGRRMKRQSWAATENKLRQIQFYPSQVARMPETLKRFSPAALWPLGPHEAVWEVAL